jgi:hypothetical protein
MPRTKRMPSQLDDPYVDNVLQRTPMGRSGEGPVFNRAEGKADAHISHGRISAHFSIVDTDWPAVRAGLEKRLPA